MCIYIYMIFFINLYDCSGVSIKQNHDNVLCAESMAKQFGLIYTSLWYILLYILRIIYHVVIVSIYTYIVIYVRV